MRSSTAGTRALTTFRALAITLIVSVVLAVLTFARFLQIDLERAERDLAHGSSLAIAQHRGEFALRIDWLDGLARAWSSFDASRQAIAKVYGESMEQAGVARICLRDTTPGTPAPGRDGSVSMDCEGPISDDAGGSRTAIAGGLSRHLVIDDADRLWIRYRDDGPREVAIELSKTAWLASFMPDLSTTRRSGPATGSPHSQAAEEPGLVDFIERACIEIRLAEGYRSIGCAGVADHPTPAGVADAITATTRIETLDVDGIEWRVILTPDQRAIGGNVTPTPFVVLFVCLALGAMIGLFVYSMTERSLRLAAQSRHMRTMLDRLGRQNRDLEQFASMAAHDLQAPMRFVVANAHVLLMELETMARPDLQELGESLVRQGDRMRALVLDLLEYCRADHKPLERSVVEPRTVIDEEVALLKTDPANADSRVELGALPESMMLDRSKFTQIVRNLVGNALKFSRGQESPVVRIEARRQAHESQWIFRIEDNGPGVPAEYHERVFEPFHRLDDSTEGTGIGLAIVRKLIERHGGRIWFDPAHRHGTALCFTLNEA